MESQEQPGYPLDLVILGTSDGKGTVAFARAGSDLAIGQVLIGPALNSVSKFQTRITNSLLGLEQRPSRSELSKFGEALFSVAIQNDLELLYQRLSSKSVSVHIVSDCPAVRTLAWEYIQEPGQIPGPSKRCIVRIVPTIGISSPAPKRLGNNIRVMFVSADPMDQDPVSWADVKRSIERTFAGRVPESFQVEAIEGIDRDQLFDALHRVKPDVFHFSGHGVVRNGKGCLVLVNRKTKKSDYITAEDLAIVLSGRGIRLAILSACQTSAGGYEDSFSSVAESLVRGGIPAVVGNQFSIPDSSVAIFVGALYKELLTGGNIDVAVSEGRVALAFNLGNFGDSAVLEWGIPTLYRIYGGSQVYEP
jgi:CHAT domain